ncbi:MAG: elongation factor Ts [Planctomycetota bacterium]|jgi:elongation factor Ts
MPISAADVRNLREKTGAPMMDCKKALDVADGNLEAAEDHLRKLGLKAAGKKVGRATGEGRCYIKVSDCGTKGGMVAVGCETDFVARTEAFEAFLDALAGHVMTNSPENAAEMLGQSWAAGGTVQDALTELIGKLGENMNLADVKFVAVDNGFVGGYIHHNQKVGVISAIKTEASREDTDAVLKQLGMHAAALPPSALSRDEIDPSLVEREKAIYLEEVKGKPEEMQEKIVQGKLNKYYGGVALREQAWVMDDSKSVEKAVADALGKGTVITDFARFSVGE